MSADAYAGEAEQCRKLVAEFAGRPEQSVLLKLASAFEDLAEEKNGGGAAIPRPLAQRQEHRVSLSAEVALKRAGINTFRVRVFDLSPKGCKIEFIVCRQ